MKKNGFTLIELLLVLSIVGIISAIIVTGCSAQMRASSQKTAARHEADVMQSLVGMTPKDLMERMGPPVRSQTIEGVSFYSFQPGGDFTTIYTVTVKDGYVTKVTP